MAEENAETPKVTTKEPETFSREYVSELRAENKGYRLKAQEEAAKAKQAEDAVAKAKQEADELVGKAKESANERIKRAEVKAVAIKAGIIDLDGLKLADLSKIKLNDDTGEIEGADALIEDLKKNKPYLFGEKVSSSNTDKKPKPDEAKPFDARKATKEEADARLKELTRRR